MYRNPIHSTEVKAVGYDVQTKTLEVEFHHGGIYQYYFAPKEVSKSFDGGESLGKFLDRNVRMIYRHVKVPWVV